jgi:hypothetical protein
LDGAGLRFGQRLPKKVPQLAAMAQMKSAQAAVDEIVRTWFHQVQSLR